MGGAKRNGRNDGAINNFGAITCSTPRSAELPSNKMDSARSNSRRTQPSLFPPVNRKPSISHYTTVRQHLSAIRGANYSRSYHNIQLTKAGTQSVPKSVLEGDTVYPSLSNNMALSGLIAETHKEPQWCLIKIGANLTTRNLTILPRNIILRQNNSSLGSTDAPNILNGLLANSAVEGYVLSNQTEFLGDPLSNLSPSRLPLIDNHPLSPKLAPSLLEDMEADNEVAELLDNKKVYSKRTCRLPRMSRMSRTRSSPRIATLKHDRSFESTVKPVFNKRKCSYYNSYTTEENLDTLNCGTFQSVMDCNSYECNSKEDLPIDMDKMNGYEIAHSLLNASDDSIQTSTEDIMNETDFGIDLCEMTALEKEEFSKISFDVLNEVPLNEINTPIPLHGDDFLNNNEKDQTMVAIGGSIFDEEKMLLQNNTNSGAVSKVLSDGQLSNCSHQLDVHPSTEVVTQFNFSATQNEFVQSSTTHVPVPTTSITSDEIMHCQHENAFSSCFNNSLHASSPIDY